MRIEKDVLGTFQLEDNELYGINTKRASENFPLGCRRTDYSLIEAIVLIKKAAAITYKSLKNDPKGIYDSVIRSCDCLLSGEYSDQFITPSLQGGAGTSTNMNVNEVIANLSLIDHGDKPGSYNVINPIDDINKGQSTNDVYPTALRIAAIRKVRALSSSCASLQEALQKKEIEFSDIKKLGRTELMDAVPITLGEEFGSYAQAISRDRWRLYKMEERLRLVNIGGTAVGTSDNADRQYRFRVIEELRRLSGIGLAAAEYPIDITQNNDVFVETSGLVKALAVNIMKISNDLRLMNSGPYGGIGEIHLAPMQQGSSIMPGKINPVIPEMAIQCSMKVIANDSAVTMAASHGEFELNAFLPLIADSILESLDLMKDTVDILQNKCIETLLPDKETCERHLSESYAFAASYIPELGYDKVSAVIHSHSPKEAKLILDNMKQ
jgi:aspartate ammonia-lyase